MHTKVGMISTRLTEAERKKMYDLAQRGVKLCKVVPSRGGMLLTYLFDYLSRAMVALAASELRVNHAERELRELRTENAQLSEQLRLAKADMPPERFEEDTRTGTANPFAEGSRP